ncbi:hypothetical protein [Halobacterium sp. R2-5]|uniref:hypothetical protein n=1 Tax=Halobacterium sp. R2-5 TaxID=2715751 RepID=UPI0014236230|nr:hypothetical protein [Halobacterium sp. R2-5]NIB99179.1 hypothetical protein [Halobacterium sp. R2-5]
MDRVRVAYDFVRAYVYALVFAAVVTGAWLLAPRIADGPQVAGLWFAVCAFGALVLATFALTQYTRRA